MTNFKQGMYAPLAWGIILYVTYVVVCSIPQMGFKQNGIFGKDVADRSNLSHLFFPIPFLSCSCVRSWLGLQSVDFSLDNILLCHLISDA